MGLESAYRIRFWLLSGKEQQTTNHCAPNHSNEEILSFLSDIGSIETTELGIFDYPTTPLIGEIE
ncbi:MAG: hypothetical protein ACFFD8_07260 [Candidatus Thorarchaeota archaeon]